MKVLEKTKIETPTKPKPTLNPATKVGSALLKRKKPDKKMESEQDGLEFLESILADEESYELPIPKERLNMIRDDLTRNHTEDVLMALFDESIRAKLVTAVMKEHGKFFNKEKKVAEDIVRECVGTGIIEKIMRNDTITDVGWNGTQLSVETNDKKWLIDGEKLDITEDYIERVISKYATVNERAFNTGNPILDGMYRNVRICAIHKDNSPDGATLAMRVARPRLALNKDNFSNFAPAHILELFEKMVQTKANICISGETGTGKTELQKLLLSFVNNHDRIFMIEDVQETHAKKLFPDKDIFSLLVTPKKPINDLVKAGLRCNPRWIIVSETRGQEAYEMLNAVLSGHFIITTLHAVNARAIPRRFVNMCGTGYTINENAVEEDINRYFDFGIHIKKTVHEGKVVRYLDEIVEFSEAGAITVFKQKYLHGQFTHENGDLSEDFKERMAEKFIEYEFPKVEREEEDEAETEMTTSSQVVVADED